MESNIECKYLLAIVVLSGYFPAVNAAIIDMGAYQFDSTTSLEWLDSDFSNQYSRTSSGKEIAASILESVRN